MPTENALLGAENLMTMPRTGGQLQKMILASRANQASLQKALDDALYKGDKVLADIHQAKIAEEMRNRMKLHSLTSMLPSF